MQRGGAKLALVLRQSKRGTGALALRLFDLEITVSFQGGSVAALREFIIHHLFAIALLTDVILERLWCVLIHSFPKGLSLV